MGLCLSHPQTKSSSQHLGGFKMVGLKPGAHENKSHIPALSHCAAHYYQGPKRKHVICVVQ